MREEFKRRAKKSLAIGALAGLAAVGGHEIGKRRASGVMKINLHSDLDAQIHAQELYLEDVNSLRPDHLHYHNVLNYLKGVSEVHGNLGLLRDQARRWGHRDLSRKAEKNRLIAAQHVDRIKRYLMTYR